MVLWLHNKRNGWLNWVTRTVFDHRSKMQKEAEKRYIKKYPGRWKELQIKRNSKDPVGQFKKRQQAKRRHREKHGDALREKDRMHKRATRESTRIWERGYRKKRFHTDILFRISCKMRSKIGMSIRRIGGSKKERTMNIIGCTISELMAHIASQFLPGMSWDNYAWETWHIDHIIPLRYGTTPAEVEALWHYSNLRPMWAPDNISKSDFMPCGARARHQKKILVSVSAVN